MNKKSNKKPLININVKNEHQQEYLENIEDNTVTFVNGVAGTGKTFLATLFAMKGLLNNTYRKIIFSRPCVEAGETIGFLPNLAI